MGVQRNPKDSMASTWRTADRTQWTRDHWLMERMNIHPTNLDQPIPVHAKSDPVPYVPHWQGHRWILVHAVWPIFLHQAYVSYFGRNLAFFAASALYTVALNVNAIREIHMIRRLGHQYGFLDGDKHDRDQVPDVGVSKVSLTMRLANIRPLMALMLAYRSTVAPSALSWWTVAEIGVYQVVLDFYFYVYHRAMHEKDSLWQYHRTHHLTKHPNPLLSLYADHAQELFDVVLIPLMAFGTMKAVGFPLNFYSLWFCHQYVLWIEVIGHSGLRLWATPPTTATWFLKMFDAELMIEDHDLHHRRGWKKSVNYGKQTRLWDRLFGTCGEREEMLDQNVDWSHAVSIPVF